MTRHHTWIACSAFLIATIATAAAQENTQRFEKVAERLVEAINARDIPAARQDFSEALGKVLTPEKFTPVVAGVLEHFGRIEKIDSPRWKAPGQVVVSAQGARQPLEISIMLDEHDKIISLWFRAPAKSIPVHDPPETTFQLPFEGRWLVLWGGDSKELNRHHESPAERFAFDFLVVDESGRSHQGEGRENGDYYCFGRPVLAPADGVVTDVIRGVRDNTPGTLNPSCACGNGIAIRHREHEVSVLGHFQQGSIRVEPGDRVKQGQVLGLCGNSGMSSEPHIHFNVQNTPICQDATALRCVFEKITVTRDGKSESKTSYGPVKGDLVSRE